MQLEYSTLGSPTGERPNEGKPAEIVLEPGATELPFRIVADKFGNDRRFLDHQILHYSTEQKGYVFAGIFMRDGEDFRIPLEKGQTLLTLKCRKIANKELLITPKKEEQKKEEQKKEEKKKEEQKQAKAKKGRKRVKAEDGEDDKSGDHDADDPKEKNASRRGNERRIGEVVALVTKWKALQGKTSSSGDSYSLEKAAAEVGVSKKTLDDYLKQVLQGLKNGFQFSFYRDLLMGALRHFNSQAKGERPSESS